MKENIDIRELIKQFTEYLADSDYSKGVVTRHNRMLRNGILKFAEEKGVSTYSTNLGNEFLAKLRSRKNSYSPWYLSLFKLHSYYSRGYIVKREQYRYGELQDLHI